MTTPVEALLFELTRRGLLDVIEGAAAEHYVSREEILGRSRLQSIVAGRRMVCRALRERGLSYPEIGRLVGRDHSTVMSLVHNDGTKQLPATLRSLPAYQLRARCGMCGATYDAHLSRPPHGLPARGCVGFAPMRAECG